MIVPENHALLPKAYEGHNLKRNLQVVSATGPTPIAAVETLLNKLDGTPSPVALFEKEEDCSW